MDAKDQIKQRLDVSEVIAEYLTLKPAGSAGFKAICPFHQEKTPSLHVSKEKQIWHCFGCDKGGDIFSFVMDIENVDFPEALRILGKKAGVEIPRFEKSESNEKQRMIALHELVTKFYQKVLFDSNQAAEARHYLNGRGMNKELIDKFAIGFSPDSWDSLTSFLSKRGFSTNEILAAGLVQRKKSGTGVIDRFRNRVMVPLRDHYGNVVGFTARIMPGADAKSGPKYMNSPETLIYKKSELLYGLDLAKSTIKQAGFVIVVEGNLDVIASHKAGVQNVVASSGTALTELQISLLKRFTDTIVFSFDQDAAGFAAAQRGIRLALSQDLKVKVVILPPEAGKDPDDAVQKDPNIWVEAVKHPIPIMDYYFQKAVQGKDMGNVDHKREIGAFLLPEIAAVSNTIEQEHWLQKLADALRIDINILRGSVKKEAVVSKKSKDNQSPQKTEKKDAKTQAVIEILGVFIQFPEHRNTITDALTDEMIDNLELKSLYKIICSLYNQPQDKAAQKSFYAELSHIIQEQESQPLERLVHECALKGENIASNTPQNQVQQQLNDYFAVIKSANLKQRKQELGLAIRQAEEAGDTETVQKLLNEYNTLR